MLGSRPHCLLRGGPLRCCSLSGAAHFPLPPLCAAGKPRLRPALPHPPPPRAPRACMQEEQVAAAARTATLPPLQSVMELTSAYKPPTRHFEASEGAEAGLAVAEAEAAPAVGRQLEDGTGVLPDGTRWVAPGGDGGWG